MAADWLVAAITGEGILALALATYLVLKGARTLSTWALAAYLACWSAYALLSTVPQFFSADWYTPPLADGILLFHALVVPAWVLFGLSYPYRRIDRIRAGLFLLWLIPALAIGFSAILNLPWAQTLAGFPTMTVRRFRLNLSTAAGLLVTLVFADTWLRSRPSRFRRQFLYFLVASLFWNLNEAFPGLVRVPMLFDANAPAQTAEFIFIALLQAGLVLGFLGVVAWRAFTGGPGERRDNAWLLLGFFLIAPLCLLQLAIPERAPGVQLAVTGFALPLLLYGAARHTIVQVELHVQTGIRGGVLGFVGLALVFVVEQSVEQWMGAEFGFLVGLAAASAAVVFMAPLRRAAEQLGRRAVPDAERTEAYLATRRLEVYEVALEGMLGDGVLDPGEQEALSKLRETLSIPRNEHDRLEASIRARVARVPVTPPVGQPEAAPP
ncbi:MAG TPA: hypothetical protein VI818_08860 [Candidatus Thermoplasmatota archaeon]|nr:hypothetical protein [Candidatus Thermoplasmatota archaeon]